MMTIPAAADFSGGFLHDRVVLRLLCLQEMENGKRQRSGEVPLMSR